MRENILTYAKSEKRSLEEHPLGEVDSLILAWLGYLHYPSSVPAFSSWEGISLEEASTKWLHKGLFRGLYGEERTRLLYEAVASSPRFSALRIFAFREEVDEERQMQFAAVSFLLPDGSCYVSFRGTDSSLVGWKEDFNMAYECPVPSQERAKRYLEEVTRRAETSRSTPRSWRTRLSGTGSATYTAMTAPASQTSSTAWTNTSKWFPES